MAKIKILKDDWKDDDTKPSIEKLVGEIVEAESIDRQGYATVYHPDGGLTDIYPEEYEIVNKMSEELNDQEYIDAGICPNCKSKLNYQNGCKVCPDCGFSACG